MALALEREGGAGGVADDDGALDGVGSVAGGVLARVGDSVGANLGHGDGGDGLAVEGDLVGDGVPEVAVNEVLALSATVVVLSAVPGLERHLGVDNDGALGGGAAADVVTDLVVEVVLAKLLLVEA